MNGPGGFFKLLDPQSCAAPKAQQNENWGWEIYP